MTEDSSKKTHLCIRCDEEVHEAKPNPDGDYVQLNYRQETRALPICMDCFREVKDRDVWR